MITGPIARAITRSISFSPTAGKYGATPDPELISNGTFNADIIGWSSHSTGTGSIAWDASGAMAVTTVDSSNRGAANTSFDTVIGQEYSFSGRQGTGNSIFQIGNSAGNGALFQSGNTDSQVITTTFTATATTTYVSVLNFNTIGVALVDDISVKAIS